MSTRTIQEFQRRAARVQRERYTVAIAALGKIARRGSENDKRIALRALGRIARAGLK